MFLFLLFYLKEDRRMEQRVLEEAKHTLCGDLAGLVAPGGHQEARGRGEGGWEAAHLPTLIQMLGMLSLYVTLSGTLGMRSEGGPSPMRE